MPEPKTQNLTLEWLQTFVGEQAIRIRMLEQELARVKTEITELAQTAPTPIRQDAKG